MLMEYVEGRQLYESYEEITLLEKQTFVQHLATVYAELFDIRYDAIGSLYSITTRPQLTTFLRISLPLLIFMTIIDLPTIAICIFLLITIISSPAKSPQQNTVKLGRAVSNDFVFSPEECSRGPFKTSADWIYARLQGARWDMQRRRPIEDETEEDVASVQAEILPFIDRLENLVPTIFPSTPQANTFTLHIHDMNMSNIIFRRDGKYTILDWEFVSTAPRGIACQLPKFLEGVDREEEPRKDRYPDTWLRQDGGNYIRGEVEDDREGYLMDLMEYEMTILRRDFLAQMEKIRPKWMKVYHEGAIMRDFLDLLRAAESGSLFDGATYRKWLDAVEKGEWRAGILTDPDDWSGVYGSVEGGDE
jgi:hypothetical protein